MPISSETLKGLPVLHFADLLGFERWLASQSTENAGAWLKLAKKAAGVPTISRQEIIDAALCFGWIDGQAQPYDDAFSLIRVTPRRQRSSWSEINRNRALELIAEGRVRGAGMVQIDAARGDGRWENAYPAFSSAAPPPDLQVALDADPAAAAAFAGLNKTKRYALILGILTVRRQETRDRKIAAFVEIGIVVRDQAAVLTDES